MQKVQRWCSLSANHSSIIGPAGCLSATGSSSENPELSEEKPIGLSLSGWLIQQTIWHCENASTHQAQTYSELTYHYLSSFPVWPTIILSSPGCCMISTVQDQQPWHADNQSLLDPLILNNISCIAETILFALLTKGCLKWIKGWDSITGMIFQTVSILFRLELINAICEYY